MQYIKAIYYREHEIDDIVTDEGNRLLANLIENGIETEWSEDKGDSKLMTFSITELDKVDTDDDEVLELVDLIKKEELVSCSYCNAMMFNYLPYTYRDNGGCIGRSYECYDCRGLIQEEAVKVANIREKEGQKEALGYTNEIYGKQ